MSQKNNFWEVTQGVLLVLLINTLVILSICLLILIIHLNSNHAYMYFILGIIGFGGFFIWQLLYVIPICIWLKRKRKRLMMKGVMIGALITALINGSYFLLLLIK